MENKQKEITLSTNQGKFVIKVYDHTRGKVHYMFVNETRRQFRCVSLEEASILSKEDAERIYKKCFEDSLHFELMGMSGRVVPLISIERVVLTMDILTQLNSLAASPNYIMWLGITEEREGDFYIKRIIVPEQKNDPTSSTIPEEVLRDILSANIDEVLNGFCFGISRNLMSPYGLSLSVSEKRIFTDLSYAGPLIGCIGAKYDGNLSFFLWEDGVKTRDILPWNVEGYPLQKGNVTVEKKQRRKKQQK